MSAPKADLDKFLASIGFDPIPSVMDQLSALEGEFNAVSRKHPIRRLNAKRQEIQIKIGEWMLETFPFLRPPAEWLVKQLDRVVARWSRCR